MINSPPKLSTLNTFKTDGKLTETIYCGVCCCAGVVLRILDAYAADLTDEKPNYHA